MARLADEHFFPGEAGAIQRAYRRGAHPARLALSRQRQRQTSRKFPPDGGEPRKTFGEHGLTLLAPTVGPQHQRRIESALFVGAPQLAGAGDAHLKIGSEWTFLGATEISGGLGVDSDLLPKTERRSAVRQRRGERGIWQRRYWEHLIRDEADYRAHMDYVHINPVKHGLVARVADWPYSTFHRLVEQGVYPPDWSQAIRLPYDD